MRHLGSIVLAIVFAPLIYILAGVGQVKFVAGTAGASTDWAAVGIGIGALVVAALLYSVLVMTRISPLGPIISTAPPEKPERVETRKKLFSVKVDG